MTRPARARNREAFAPAAALGHHCSMRRWAPLLMLFATACGDDPARIEFDARIVTADGANPLTVGDFDRLELTFVQDGLEPVVRTVDLDGEDFALGADFEPLLHARARVVFSGPSGTLHGAPPRFLPVDAQFFLRIRVGAPGTCAVVERLRSVEPARRDSAYVRWGDGYSIQFGGVAASGPSAAVTFSDHFWSTAGEAALPSLIAAAGRTKASLYGELQEGTTVVISEGGGPWRYDLSVEDDADRTRPLTLYPGADIGSALARTAFDPVSHSARALVAGGGDIMEQSADFAVLAGDGVLIGTLAGARAHAAAAPLGDRMLVVGGIRVPGAPFAELVDLSALTTLPIEDPAEGTPRTEPLLIVGRDSVWVVGGTGPDGLPITDTRVIAGCPSACTVTAGPSLNLGPAPRHEGTHLVAGDAVYRAVEEGGWHVEPIADLVHPREAPGMTVYESGIVFVQGGQGTEGPRLDAELCFPTSLTPLE